MLFFYEESEMGLTSSFVEGVSNPTASTYSVSVESLDTFSKKAGIQRISLLKIDTEGFDIKALSGAENLLKNHHIDVIQFEYSNYWKNTKSTLGAALNLLSGYGYSTSLLSPNGLEEFDYQRYGEVFGWMNFVSVSPNIELSI